MSAATLFRTLILSSRFSSVQDSFNSIFSNLSLDTYETLPICFLLSKGAFLISYSSATSKPLIIEQALNSLLWKSFILFSNSFISSKSPKSKPIELSLFENMSIGLGTIFKKLPSSKLAEAISIGFFTTSLTGISLERYLFTNELLAPFSSNLLTR